MSVYVKKAFCDGYPHQKKLEQLATYAIGKDDCKCKCWRNAGKESNFKIEDLNRMCSSCGHNVSMHEAMLRYLPIDVMNELLGVGFEADFNLSCFRKETDLDSKDVFFRLYLMLFKSIRARMRPVHEESVEFPPFEMPNIEEGLINFVVFKFRDCCKVEFDIMRQLAKFVMHGLNALSIFTHMHDVREGHDEEDDDFHINYSRWLYFCSAPSACESLPYYSITSAFGRTFLGYVFPRVKHKLLDAVANGRNKSINENAKYLPAFLSLLEKEIYNEQSPIWDPHFHCQFPSYQVSHDSESEIVQPLSSEDPKKSRKEVKKKRKSKGKRRRMPKDNPEASGGVSEIPEGVLGYEDDEATHSSTQCQKKLELRIICSLLAGTVNKQCVEWLKELQNLFFQLIPSSSQEYVHKCLFDPEYTTLALIENNRVAGGICFQIYEDLCFADIVAYAITPASRVKGYGTFMMSHLKDYMLQKNVMCMITSASANLVEAYKEQGFTEDAQLMPLYLGFIHKDQNLTLLEFTLNQHLKYAESEAVLPTEITEFMNDIDPGVRCLENVEKAPSIPELVEAFAKVESLKDEKILKDEKCLEVNSKPEERQRPYNMPDGLIVKTLKGILSHVKKQKCAKPFIKLINSTKFPDYKDQLKYPIDLQMIANKLQNHQYRNQHFFRTDVLKMTNNCRIYYKFNPEYCKKIDELELLFEGKMKAAHITD